MKRVGHYAIPLLVFGLLLTGLTGRTTQAAPIVEVPPLPNRLDNRTDATGYLNWVWETTLAPLSYVRLTSGTCLDFPSDAYVFQGETHQEAISSAADIHYLAELHPQPGLAQSLANFQGGWVDIGPPNSAVLFPPGRAVIAALIGGPPNTVFHLCLLTQPELGTYCGPYQGSVICQKQFAGGGPAAQAAVTLDAGGPYAGVATSPLTFTASSTNQPEGVDYAITWDFGDGTTQNGAIVKHTYSSPGTYSVTTVLALYPSGVTLAQAGTTATITLPSLSVGTVNAPSTTPNPALGTVGLPPLSPAWTRIGSATSDDGGSWRFSMNVGQDLLGAGLTVIRVTSAPCDTPVDQAFVFEAQLQATQAGDQSWGGQLAPIGIPAESLPVLNLSSGDVHFIPTLPGTLIDTGLDGVPPDTLFAVCLRQP